MKKFILLLIMILLPVSVFALVVPNPVHYVTDEANVLSKENEDDIVLYSHFLDRTEKIDFFVVTVNTIGLETLDDYANEVYDSFAIQPSGVMIFFAKNERSVKVIIGGEVNNFIEEKTIQDFIDSFIMPYFESQEWEEGIMNGYKAFFKLICEYYEIDASELEVSDRADFLMKYKYPIFVLFVILCGALGAYFSRIFHHFEKGELEAQHILLFIILFPLNVLILATAFSMEPFSLLFLFGVEVLAILNSFSKGGQVSLEETIYYAQKKEKQQQMKRRKPKRLKKKR